MRFMEYRAYCVKQKQEVDLCRFWINEKGEVDTQNLPDSGDIGQLLQSLRLYEVHVEFTGRIEDEK